MRRLPWLTFVLVAACGGCPDGQLDCAGRCVDVPSDPSNCGSCGAQCLGAQACVDGLCGCPAGTETCGGDCVALEDDPAHCGTCFRSCADGAVCTAGACACPDGSTDCDGTCVSLGDDAANCGACGVMCPAEQACAAGSCGCSDPSLSLCGTTCVDLQTDTQSCGSCDRVCAVGFCAAGRCVPTLEWAEAHASGGSMPGMVIDYDGRVAMSADGSTYLAHSRAGGDVTLVAYTAAGVVRWTREIRTAAQRVGDVSIIENGGVALTVAYDTGWTNPLGTTRAPTGSSDLAVVAYNPNGAVRWEYFVRSAGQEMAGGLGAGGGLVAVGGTVGGSFDFGGVTLTGVAGDGFVLLLDAVTGNFVDVVAVQSPETVRPVFVELASDGDVIVGGLAPSGVNLGLGSSAPAWGFLARLRPDLTPRWSRGVDTGDVHGVAVAGDVIYVAGLIGAAANFGDGVALTPPLGEASTFVLSVDASDGRSLWVSSVDTPASKTGRGPVVDDAGRIWHVAAADMFGSQLVAHRPEDGLVLYAEPLATGLTTGRGIATAAGRVVIGGRFTGMATFGSETFTATPTGLDVFVALFSL